MTSTAGGMVFPSLFGVFLSSVLCSVIQDPTGIFDFSRKTHVDGTRSLVFSHLYKAYNKNTGEKVMVT